MVEKSIWHFTKSNLNEWFFSIWYYHICTCIQNMNLYYYYQCIKWIAICIFLSCGDEKWLERVSTMKWKCQNFSMSTVIWYKWEELWLWQKFQLPSRREWTLKINLILSCFLKSSILPVHSLSPKEAQCWSSLFHFHIGVKDVLLVRDPDGPG